MGNYVIEVCAAHVQSAIEAEKGGAQRVELCDNLYEGGTTPSYAAIKTARAKINIKLHIMIRPRGSDFCYSELEFGMMKEDISICKKLGCDGVVFGILLPDGNIDVLRTAHLIELAKPMQITFHRAFDMTPEPFKAMQQLIELKTDRILTAGQKNTVPEGMELIRQLISASDDRIIIMPGSGINENNIQNIRDNTGAREFHLTGKKSFESKMTYRKEGIFMGGLSTIPEYQITLTDAGRIRQIAEFVQKA